VRTVEIVLTAVLGALFLSLLISGGYLAYMGGPYNTVVVTVHKIFSLVAIGLTAATIYVLLRGRQPSHTIFL
jgi:hypothetical protein